MSEKPILFSAPMVRAILAGTKTQTRRVVKPQWQGLPLENADYSREALEKCPYGQPGSLLWVRETWQYANWTDDGYPFIGYRADEARVLHERYPEEWAERLSETWAALSAPENYGIDNRAADRRWRPAIHMPRWASRIELRVTSVRVERLQDMSAADAFADGGYLPPHHATLDCDTPDPREAFRELWDSINAERAPWESNPWVWVVGFERA